MWNCGACGCQSIAASITACPVCGKEMEMPKATSGGSSNQGDTPSAEATETPASSLGSEAGGPVPAEGSPADATAVSVAPVGPTAPGENGPDGTPPASDAEAAADAEELERQERELQAQIDALRARNKRV